jgi:hypothetical protein
MRPAFLILVILLSQLAKAQHCPWDCSGMILMKTTIAKEQLYKLKPVLVDENKNIIIDTIYGTGLDTYDTCNFLYYDDFIKYRAGKISLHHWYGYDTVYHFASGYYMVKTNFCKYKGRKLFLQFTEPGKPGLKYHYLEIKPASLFHLHDFNREINERKTAEIKKAVLPFIFIVNEKDLGLQ